MPSLPVAITVALVAVNVATFVAFGFDKWCARRGRRRISEARLLLLTFAGGILGGWIGMSLFRHKTRKTSFRVRMVLVSIANLAWGLAWLAMR
jgi:uncharacterized membrane protein YsdA (DUF1294 family)